MCRKYFTSRERVVLTRPVVERTRLFTLKPHKLFVAWPENTFSRKRATRSFHDNLANCGCWAGKGDVLERAKSRNRYWREARGVGVCFSRARFMASDVSRLHRGYDWFWFFSRTTLSSLPAQLLQMAKLP